MTGRVGRKLVRGAAAGSRLLLAVWEQALTMLLLTARLDRRISKQELGALYSALQ